MLARVARREALSALAEAASQEMRSAQLAARSRELAHVSRTASPATDGESLRTFAKFAGALEALAREAERACVDATEQAGRHAEALARADTRTQRLEDRLSDARGALREVEERRRAPVPTQLARGLQNQTGGGEHGPAVRQKRSRR